VQLTCTLLTVSLYTLFQERSRKAKGCSAFPVTGRDEAWLETYHVSSLYPLTISFLLSSLVIFTPVVFFCANTTHNLLNHIDTSVININTVLSVLCQLRAPYSSSCGGPATSCTQELALLIHGACIHGKALLCLYHEKTPFVHYHTGPHSSSCRGLAHFAHQLSHYDQPQEGASPPLLSFLRNNSPVL
jgi:hypothetical protein